jgi:RimJ/RimL family protein N-acetyltransferase
LIPSLTPTRFSKARVGRRTKACGFICSRDHSRLALAFDLHLHQKASSEDPLFFAIVDKPSGDAVGYAAYMRIEPTHRVIEVGSILYTPRLQRTIGATETMYLMARHVFSKIWDTGVMNGSATL